jgi:DNA-binding MarR family transcriptional regulator
MQVTSANVTFLVDGLEKDELVRRVPSLNDRRTVFVELTDAGRTFADRIVSTFATFAARMFEGFSEGEKRQLSDLLDRLRYNSERFEAKATE